MTFEHNPIDIPEVSTKTVNRKRFYVTPTGLYPSITTVLGVRKAKQKGCKSGVNELVTMLLTISCELLHLVELLFTICVKIS